ncbi:hypothetical protein M404DRAFT_416410 [Pisolithus tinctorius Marx 270]|uniref:Uncharacterized protein n=1 Tax=Pisolithus tinctorius Marx 270 TaxID=870435 RepID=A0A0C3P1D7_PISTI|nr:hypothetical protein M404DRAFT_416410 [Pisolithus tinctorius Marx 270]
MYYQIRAKRRAVSGIIDLSTSLVLGDPKLDNESNVPSSRADMPILAIVRSCAQGWLALSDSLQGIAQRRRIQWTLDY